eukprot:Filipodium_phascolosomae@DN3538_c0_g1_i1.p1
MVAIQNIVDYYSAHLSELLRGMKLNAFKIKYSAGSLYRRFFTHRSALEFNPVLVMFTCVLIALKAENYQDWLGNFIHYLQENKNQLHITIEDMLLLELPVLEVVKFHLLILHPRTALLHLLQTAESTKLVRHGGDSLLRDCMETLNLFMRTEISLLLSPAVLAALALWVSIERIYAVTPVVGSSGGGTSQRLPANPGGMDPSQRKVNQEKMRGLFLAIVANAHCPPNKEGTLDVPAKESADKIAQETMEAVLKSHGGVRWPPIAIWWDPMKKDQKAESNWTKLSTPVQS